MKKVNSKDIVIILIIISTFIVNFTLIFNDSVWQDEAYTMNIIKNDFIGIIKSTMNDVHPPLYYFIAKIFTMCLGYSVPVVKLASIVPVILTIIFVWLKTKKLFPEKYAKITTLFSLLIGFIPVAFTQNIELRMYTWAMFFTTCNGIFAYELHLNHTSKKKLFLFVLTALCTAYTHYYAALTECYIYLFLFLTLILKHKAWKEMLVIMNITITGYLPWLPIFIKQFIIVKDYWWLTTFDVKSIIGIIKYPFNGMFLYIFLILIAIILIQIAIYLFRNKKDKEMWFSAFCILSFILMVATGCMVSLLVRPVFTARYTYNAIGLLILGFSIASTKIKFGNIIRYALITLTVLNFPFSYRTTYVREYETGTEQFKEFAKSIDKKAVIVTPSNDIYHTLPYYLPENEIKWKSISKDTKGYIFINKTLEEIKQKIPSLEIEELFSGDIDRSMKFSVYFIK